MGTGGLSVSWLRDGLGLIASPEETEALAATVEDTGGVYFVPAFSGLLAPYWREDARGLMIGLTQYVIHTHTHAHARTHRCMHWATLTLRSQPLLERDHEIRHRGWQMMGGRCK